MTESKHKAKFGLGKIVATPGVLEIADELEMKAGLLRFVTGDWGECCEDDKAENEAALREGRRLMGVYQTIAGETFWIITEWDRSATTILLPDDY